MTARHLRDYKISIQTTLLLILSLVLHLQAVKAQDKLSIKFGKIVATDFDLSKAKFDSSASAVVIADIGNTSFEGNTKGRGDFTLVYKRFKRIKIISKTGFDIANESFVVYSDGIKDEILSDVKASSYNLENGKIVETKLDDKSIYTEKMDRLHSRKKFTVPGVKEGSIIEIAYTIKSDFYTHLRPWNFQGDYPVLRSEYEVRIPKFFNYVVLKQGDPDFFVETKKSEPASYSLRVSGGAHSDDIYHIDANDIVAHWIKKDVPPLKEENFTTTVFNHRSRVEFQLNYIQFSETSNRENYLTDWTNASNKLLNNEYFGLALDKDNHWMSEDLRPVVGDIHDDVKKMEVIYRYVRDNFTCHDRSALFTDNSLKSVFKARSGNVAEINLLLVAMLRHENIQADPVVLSTRSNGYASEVYPLMERFNYVICAASSGNNTYYLDASDPMMGFGHLPVECYNGVSRVVNRENPHAVYFDADSLREDTKTSVMIINDEKGKPSGFLESTPGYYQSTDLREIIRKSGEKEYFKQLELNCGTGVSIENTGIDSLSQFEYPVKIHFDFDIKVAGNDLIYFNPMLSDRYAENPFKPTERRYPVEMPYTFDKTYTFSMEIPEGYEIDEIPKSAKVAYNEKEGLFEYLIQKNATGIQMRCRVKLNKANFSPDEYGALRDFFGFIVKKQSEQIVFKKKK